MIRWAVGAAALTLWAQNSVTIQTIIRSRPASAVEGGRLIEASDLRYVGAFRLPRGSFGAPVHDGFAYGGTALAYHRGQGSLFLVGHDWHQLVAEVRIPSITNARRVDGLATAAVVQPFADVTEGNRGRIKERGGVYAATAKIGGLLVHEGKLYGTVFAYYDGASEAALSHFRSGLKLSAVGDFEGMFRVGEQNPGFVAGYMASVPADWVSALGGQVLTGSCCLSVIGRTSLGPAAASLDPSELRPSAGAPASLLVGYPLAHPLDGQGWDTTNGFANGSTEVKGLVFPEGSRSLLFFGRHGAGPFCYGTGEECKDPADGSKGTHGYPYRYQAWAYDARDLAEVRTEGRKPWSVRPTSVWTFDLPFDTGGARIGGAAYDPDRGRVFLSQLHGDGELPVIHVLEILPSPSGRPPGSKRRPGRALRDW